MPDNADEHTGGESSKSNSITSEHSIQSIGVSASSHSSSTNSTPNMNEITNMSTNDHYPTARNRHKVLLIYYYRFNALHMNTINYLNVIMLINNIFIWDILIRSHCSFHTSYIKLEIIWYLDKILSDQNIATKIFETNILKK